MSYWILSLFPHMDTRPIRPMYEIQWWSQDKGQLKAWQKGNTGYPLVSFSFCQQNFIKTFQIEAMIALVTKMVLIFS